MKEKPVNEKTCQNCRNYSQHYSKLGTKYIAVFCGHCLKRKNNAKRKSRPFEACEYWEDIAIKKEERKKSINETLERMSQRLEEIAAVLKDDTE